MKNYLLLLLCSAVTANAQEFRGEAEYQTKKIVKITSLDANGVEIANDPFIEQTKKAFEKVYVLYFDRVASVYEEKAGLGSLNADGTAAANTATNDKKYKNLKTKTWLEQVDFFGKDFLISDSLEKYDWKLEGETKKIGNYNCYKATYVVPREIKEEKVKAINILGDDKEKDFVITAWYTPEIPVSQGPDKYWGLPGLILEITSGSDIILCTKITLNPKEKHEIVPLKKGEKVTRAELTTILEKKMKEMNDMHGGGQGSPPRAIKKN